MDSQGILDRLMAAYGVSSQKALAEALSIPANNISGWIQRDSIPGNPIIKCALDTGVDLAWLVNGEFANANIDSLAKHRTFDFNGGKVFLKKMMSEGGKSVLLRILSAYGFKTQKELSEYFGISTGTISTWVRRDFFPADMVIACVLDTGVSLEWVSTGAGEPFAKKEKTTVNCESTVHIPQKILHMGKIESRGSVIIDIKLLPEVLSINSLIFVKVGVDNWIVNSDFHEISNGFWLLDIDGVQDIYSIFRKPGNNIKVSGKDASFECNLNDIIPQGVIVGNLKLY